MEIRVIHNVSMVYELIKYRSRYDNMYQFYNLLTNQWNNVVCYGLFVNDKLQEIAMLSINYHIPVLLATGFDNEENTIELVKRIKPFLPANFYTHINSTTLQAVFSQDNISGLEEYMNMGLCHHDLLNEHNIRGVSRLGYSEINEIKELIAVSHPEAWLDDYSVRLGENFGVYIDNKLISFAGLHAYSEHYQVAAIAHVTTHPDYRNRGLATKAVAALAKSLQAKIKFVGLNVKVDNMPAIHCYTQLGFEECGRFVACEIRIKDC